MPSTGTNPYFATGTSRDVTNRELLIREPGVDSQPGVTDLAIENDANGCPATDQNGDL